MASNPDKESRSQSKPALARLKLIGDLARVKSELEGSHDALARLKLVARSNQIRIALGSAPATAHGDDLSDDPNSPNYRYRDTGYIPNSRKELAANQIASARKAGLRLRASDIDFDAIEQNPRQASELVTKANLFGKTDWQTLQDNGMKAGAGFLIEKIYASISPVPVGDGADVRRDYAIGLESIRDRLQPSKTVNDVLAVVEEIADELIGHVMSPEDADRYREISKELNAITPILNRLWSLGSKSSEYSELRNQYDSLYSERINIRNETFKKNLTDNQTTRSWKTFGDRFSKLVLHSYYRGSKSFQKHIQASFYRDHDNDWSWLDKDSTSTRGEHTKNEDSFQLLVADKFERHGGKPVSVSSTQALKKMLGLRDVQSGNWVLKDPESAKFHVEQTAGAMSDLADIVGIDVSALGLGGRLGMAFGARGNGGRAAAHYEPVHRVINLTKMGGGGALGHELFHAIDNILHELVNQNASGSKGDFVTADPSLLPDGEIKNAVIALRAALLAGDERLPETIDFSKFNIDKVRKFIDTNNQSINETIRFAGSAQKAVLAVDDWFKRYRSRTKKSTIDYWRQTAAAYYAKDGETSVEIKTGPAMSKFAKEALALDRGVPGKYWSKPIEMAARAFQTWLEDSLASQNRRNDYLSAKADNKHYFNPQSGKGWKPFPDDDERTRINKAFDRLFAAIRDAKVFEKAAQNTALLDSIFGREPTVY